MSKSMPEIKIEILKQELIEFESWAEYNFHSLPYIAQIMMVRGKIATEDRIERLEIEIAMNEESK